MRTNAQGQRYKDAWNEHERRSRRMRIIGNTVFLLAVFIISFAIAFTLLSV